MMLVHLPGGNHGAIAVRDRLLAAIKTLPSTCEDLTWDQGTELAQHQQITMATKMDIYFCDPHSPGSEGPMKTPMNCYANISPKAPT